MSALLRHQHDVIQEPRLQLLDVGGALAGWEGQVLNLACCAVKFDSQTVPVDLSLRVVPLDHRRRGGRLDDLEVGGSGDD